MIYMVVWKGYGRAAEKVVEKEHLSAGCLDAELVVWWVASWEKLSSGLLVRRTVGN